MKLSMWIIANMLDSFEPQIHIRNESPRILRSARLAHATDCVYVYQDGSDCVYSWESDTIRLPDLSAREGFELLQNVFDSMFDWHTQLCELIDRREFQKAVDLCHSVFRNPVYLSDGNHQCIALSSQYGPKDVDSEWYHLKTYGYSSLDSTRQMNRAQVSHHFGDRLLHYRFDQSEGLVNCTCAAVMNEGMPVGYLTIMEKDRAVNYGHMQLLAMMANRLSSAMGDGLEFTDDTTPTLKLLLDGKPLGKKTAGEQAGCYVLFDTVYQPGTLEAVSCENGKVIGKSRLTTAEGKCHLEVQAERPGTEEGLIYINIAKIAANGAVAAHADEELTVSAEGNLRILGFGSGDPKPVFNYTENHTKTFNGQALLVVQKADPHSPAAVTVTSATDAITLSI